MDDRKSIEGMIGEGFRDVGILIFVFALLGKVIAGSITGWWTLTAIAISGAFFFAGCYLEGGDRLPDYTSLLLGSAWGLAVFLATMARIKYKEKHSKVPPEGQTGFCRVAE